MKLNFLKKNNIYLIIFAFVLGIIFIIKSYQYETKYVETMTSSSSSKNDEETSTQFSDKCPNLLLNDGNKLYLYNDKKAKIPGVNPIVFNNLEEYVEYVEFARSQGVQCPLLYLRKMNNAQGDDVYAIRSSPFTNDVNPQNEEIIQEMKKLDVSELNIKDKPDYNSGSYPGFDGNNQSVGKILPMDDLEK